MHKNEKDNLINNDLNEESKKFIKTREVIIGSPLSTSGKGIGVGIPDNKSTRLASKIIAAICCLLFALAGVWLINIGVQTCIKASKYEKVEAYRVRNEYIDNLYYSVYEYIVDGQVVEGKSTIGTAKPSSTNVEITVHYLKSDPLQVTEEEIKSFSSGIFSSLFGVPFVLVGVLLIFPVLKQSTKVEEDDEKEDAKEVQKPVKEADKIETCEYCGEELEKGKPCKGCGAKKE